MSRGFEGEARVGCQLKSILEIFLFTVNQKCFLFYAVTHGGATEQGI